MDYDDLDDRTQAYLASLRHTARLSASEVSHDSYQEIISVLASVLIEVCMTIRCGADWDEVKYHRPTGVACALLQDKKTSAEFRLMVDACSTVFEFHLAYFEELIHVDDSFWELMLSLRRLGSMNYELSLLPVDSNSETWERALGRSKRSNIFAMIADYALLSKEMDNNPETSAYGYNRPSISLTWPHGCGWERLFPTLIEATKIGWRMNYLLYRSARQRNSRGRNKCR